jgi:DNA-binding XRE family transcriptional regulator
MVHRDPRAGRLIRQVRVDLGLSPEALSHAIYTAGYGTVSARTIRRIEADGMVPRVSAQFALAQFCGRSVTTIWPLPATTRKLAA